MKIVENVAYGSHPAQTLDLYLPEGAVNSLFLYFHGGGLVAGDKGNEASVFAPYLAEKGVAVASANYRMYPQADYPDFIRDAALCVAWAKGYGTQSLSCDTLFVGGSSAGGYLSMMLCFDPRYLAEVGLDNGAIAGYFHDAGQPTAHFTVLKNRGIDPRRVIVDETAPLYHVGTAAVPPMRFIVSDQDMKNRYEQIMLTLSTLKHLEYEGFDHVVMQGKHCAYCKRLDDRGESVLGQMIFDFIQSVNA